jgi:hypothetical protein
VLAEDGYRPVVAAPGFELSCLNVLAPSALPISAGGDPRTPTSAEAEWNALHASLSSCGGLRAKSQNAPEKGFSFPADGG